MNIEILVHNIGHHDVYFCLRSIESNKTVIALPINKRIKLVGERVYIYMQENNIQLRCTEHTHYVEFSQQTLPIHTVFSTETYPNPSVNQIFELSKSEQNTISLDETWVIYGIVIPIYAPILHDILTKSDPISREYHVILTTKGAKEKDDRSPEFMARILELVNNTYASRCKIHTRLLHDESSSQSNDYTFDKREIFCQRVLSSIADIRRPLIEYYKETPTKWKEYFTLHLSVNTGTIPVIISLFHSLQHVTTDMYHVPKAKAHPIKTHELYKIDLLPNESVILHTPIHSDSDVLSPIQKIAIKGMQEWSHEYTTKKPERENTDKERSFFFRKGRQEVLALVVLHKPSENSEYSVIRGVNLEVSLPTGSLCAERNAIGSALVQHPMLRRDDILCVAVLSLSESKGARLGPCGACREWLQKLAETNPEFSIITFADHACSKVYIEYM